MRLPRSTRPVLAAVLVAAGALVALPATAATAVSASTGVDDFEFSSFEADYYLGRDAEGHSTLRTVETLVAEFPNYDQNRGIIRAIPAHYDGVPLETTVVSISDSEGNTEPYEVIDTGDFIEVSLGTDDFVQGTVSYTLTYDQRNVVRAFADTGVDELYWDTNGTGFAQPFGSTTARVHVDPSVAPTLTGAATCYRGPQGSTDTCEITRADDAATGSALLTASTPSLGAGENLTVAIAFTAGTFVQVPADPSYSAPTVPSPGDPDYTGGDYYYGYGDTGPTPTWSHLLGGFLTLLAVGGGAVALFRRFGPGRDAPGRGVIIPQYSVPRGVNLLEAAALLGRDHAGISAQLVSFAVRGNLRILDYPVSSGDARYTLQLVHANNVDPQEHWMLQAIFAPDLAPGAVREIGVTDDQLATAFGNLGTAANGSVELRGWRGKSSMMTGIGIAVGLVILGFIEVIAIIGTTVIGAFSPWFAVALAVTIAAALLSFIVALRKGGLTPAGAEQKDYLLGMRMYLELAEEERFQALQSPAGAERVNAGKTISADKTVSAGDTVDTADRGQVVKLYEKLLPFAVLWGIEEQWSEELAAYYDQTDVPDWYVGNGGYNSFTFANSIGGWARSVHTTSTPPAPAMSSSGRSWMSSGGGSSFGGSGGGGFSGGGGGGGGGGGR